MYQADLTYCRSSFEAAFDRLEHYNRSRYQYSIKYFGRRALIWAAATAGFTGGVLYYDQLITLLSLCILATAYFSIRCLLSWLAERRFLGRFRKATLSQLRDLDQAAGYRIGFDERRIILVLAGERETYVWEDFSFFIDEPLFIYLGDNRRNDNLLLPADALPESVFGAFRAFTRRNISNELLLEGIEAGK